jgi:hypothetical protein
VRSLLGLFVIVLVLPALLLTSGHANAFCEILEPPSPLPTRVNGTQVEIQLTDGFARVVIIKEFYNPSDVLKEGQVFFPLEKGHDLITDLSLKVGNVVYNSSSGDRGGALDDFLDAVAKGQDAALVQYDPPRDVYWIAVTIPPRQARTTITTLEMPLTKRDGFYEYHYRLSVDARDSVDYLRVHVRVETAAPLHVHLGNHPAVPILRSGERAADMYMNDTATIQGRDLHVHFGSVGSSPSQYVDGDGARFVRYAVGVGDPAFQASLAPLPRSFLVALDASGSMSLNGRWATAKDAVRRLIADLRPGETVGLIAFGGPSVRVLDDGLREATTELGPHLERFLDPVTPRGSTSYAAAIPTIDRWSEEASSRGAQPIFVLVSDGRPTRGPLGLELETAYSRVSTDRSLPIYALAVRPSDHPAENLLRNLSHFQRGDSFTISGVDVAAAVSALVSSIRVPVLQGITSDLPGSPEVDPANPNSQTLLQGGETVVLAKLRGSSEDPVTFRLGWDAGSSRATMERTFPGAEIPSQSLLKRQWTLGRIHALLTALRAHEDASLVESLKAFATANRVVTPYTSLLVTIPPASPGPGDAQSVGGGESRFIAFPGPLPTSPASGLLTSGPFSLSPLEAEGRRAEAIRRDLANPLVSDREIDRWVPISAPESARIDQGTAIVRFDGTYLRVFEVGEELVGVYREGLFPTPLSMTGVGLAVAVLSAFALLVVRRRRPEGRQVPERPLDGDGRA